MLEIYCERLQDLLNEEAMLNSGGGGGRNNNSRGGPLRLREHPESGFYGPFCFVFNYYLIPFISAHFFDKIISSFYSIYFYSHNF
jgi:hypothetical protein